jgi:hypothetical protein
LITNRSGPSEGRDVRASKTSEDARQHRHHLKDMIKVLREAINPGAEAPYMPPF